MLVFTGAMDYLPNIDAVNWFAREILPRVRTHRPEVRFCIVGARPAESVRALANLDGIRVTGTVADVRPYLEHASIAVVPVRIARGIQNKALEAMAMGRPLVITTASAKAINATPGESFCVAADADSFARVVLELLSDPQRAARVANAGRAAILRNYSWTSNLARIAACFRDINASSRAGYPANAFAEA